MGSTVLVWTFSCGDSGQGLYRYLHDTRIHLQQLWKVFTPVHIVHFVVWSNVFLHSFNGIKRQQSSVQKVQNTLLAGKKESYLLIQLIV